MHNGQRAGINLETVIQGETVGETGRNGQVSFPAKSSDSTEGGFGLTADDRQQYSGRAGGLSFTVFPLAQSCGAKAKGTGKGLPAHSGFLAGSLDVSRFDSNVDDTCNG